MRRFAVFVAFAAGLFAGELGGFFKSADLEFTRLDLTDGRRLNNVVVKSFNPSAQTLFVVADRTAMTIPLRLIPPAVRPMFQSVRLSGATSPTTAAPAPAPVAIPQSQAESKASNTDTPAAETEPTIGAKEHTEFARRYADDYYRTKHQYGTGAVSAYVNDVVIDECAPMQGWDRQFRSQGHADVSIAGHPTKLTFEVLSKEKDDHSLALVQFSRKS